MKNEKDVERLARAGEECFASFGGGLYVKVGKRGTVSWVYVWRARPPEGVYQPGAAGGARVIGHWPAMPLFVARQVAVGLERVRKERGPVAVSEAARVAVSEAAREAVSEAAREAAREGKGAREGKEGKEAREAAREGREAAREGREGREGKEGKEAREAKEVREAAREAREAAREAREAREAMRETVRTWLDRELVEARGCIERARVLMGMLCQ